MDWLDQLLSEDVIVVVDVASFLRLFSLDNEEFRSKTTNL